MYRDREKSPWRVIILVLLILLAACLPGVFRGRQSADMKEEGAQAIRYAVERSARQCYVVEGVYPESLEYLEDNYGLTINKDNYYVTYDAFASNLPPTVRVTPK